MKKTAHKRGEGGDWSRKKIQADDKTTGMSGRGMCAGTTGVRDKNKTKVVEMQE